MSSYYDYCYQYSALKKIVRKNGLGKFVFFKKFTDNTSQGSVGILKYVDNLDTLAEDSDDSLEARNFILNVSPSPKVFIIYKIGTETPFLTTHEYLVSKSLYSATSKFLPNFERPFDFIKDVEADPARSNPFYSNTCIINDMILYEYICSCTTLAKLIEDKVKLAFPIINSLINQLMIAIIIAQTKIGFVHNDLHFDNVLISKCLKRTFMVYIFKTGEEIRYALIPTYGYYPVVIDYGFSYTNDLINKNLYIGIHHDNKGYITHRLDVFTDFKTMMTRLNYSGYQFKDDNGETKKKYNKAFNATLGRLPIDKQTGWDKVKSISISKNLIHTIRPFIKAFLNSKDIPKDSFIERYEAIVVDILCSLIILPLEAKPQVGLVESLDVFLGEWLKIEKWLGSSTQKIYILKNIVSIISDSLWCETLEVDEVIHKFKDSVFDLTATVGNHITLDGLNFEDLYKSIINLSSCFESIMYRYDIKCQERKRLEWSMMSGITSAYDMYSIVEPFIAEANIQISLDDYFIVFDSVSESTFSFVADDSKIIEVFNDMKDYSEKIQYLLNLTSYFKDK